VIASALWIRFATRLVLGLVCRRQSWQAVTSLLEQMRVSIERVRLGRPAKSLILVGLRGVGKTVLLDRITPKEKRYMRAMAELGPGPHRSGDIAQRLGRKSSAFAGVRSNLIEKGMIWSPAYGETDFTVPIFDAFMKRMMPGNAWESTN
jgi:GTPase SAR1 family protein